MQIVATPGVGTGWGDRELKGNLCSGTFTCGYEVTFRVGQRITEEPIAENRPHGTKATWR